MRKIDPFHYGRIEKDEVNQQAVQNYFQLIDEAEAFYNAQIRQVVEQHQGTIGVESEKGRSTTVTIELEEYRDGHEEDDDPGHG